MVLLEFSIAPSDKGESLGEYVAEALDIVDKSGVPYRLNPMGTVLEGEWDEVMGVVKSCYEQMRKSSKRIGVTMKIDAREDAQGRLDGKIQRLESVLGRELKKS